MNKILLEKIRESCFSVLPISAIVLLLSITIAPMPLGVLMLFLFGAVLLVFGMGFFTLGAEMSMMPTGEEIGKKLTGTRRVGLMVICCFLLGLIITVAEPDLQVLARQVPAVPNLTLILCVAVGVGVFLVIALLRILFRWPLSRLLIAFYSVLFVISFFVPRDFLSVAFDAGGVTTGPITVPFIMAYGIGMAAIRTDRRSEEDSFGLISLCSIGPILSVLVLGLCFGASAGTYSPVMIPDIGTTQQAWLEFSRQFPHYLGEVAAALLPIVVVFAIFQLALLRLPRRRLPKLAVGLVYTYVGLTLFLTGVNVGFMPAGQFLGQSLAQQPHPWIMIPLGMIIGFFIVKAEPAVLVLNQQVEDITGGAIPGKAMELSLSVGVAVALGLAMLRVLTGISIYWLLIPGYVLALGLTFFVPRVFTAIAFDSGGVASGPMATTFVLPFAMGACEAIGGNVLVDAFGCVAMIAMTPLITIQLLGLIYRLQTERKGEKYYEADE